MRVAGETANSKPQNSLRPSDVGQRLAGGSAERGGARILAGSSMVQAAAGRWRSVPCAAAAIIARLAAGVVNAGGGQAGGDFGQGRLDGGVDSRIGSSVGSRTSFCEQKAAKKLFSDSRLFEHARRPTTRGQKITKSLFGSFSSEKELTFLT